MLVTGNKDLSDRVNWEEKGNQEGSAVHPESLTDSKLEATVLTRTSLVMG